VLIEPDGELALVEGPLIWSALGELDPTGLGVYFDDAGDPFAVVGAHVRDGALSGATAGRIIDRARAVGAALKLPAPPPPGEAREPTPEEEAEAWVDGTYDDRGPSGRLVDRDRLNRSVLLRQASVAGTVVPGLETPAAPALVVADRGAPAGSLVRAVAATEGAIAVSLGGQLTTLRLDFAQSDRAQRALSWVEVRLGPGGTASVEPVPDKPTVVEPTGGRRDVAALAKAVVAARTKRKWPATIPIDILVDPTATDLDAQQFVDVLAALDRAGVSTVGLGFAATAGSTQAVLRGHRTPTLDVGPTSLRGRRRRDTAELDRRVEPLRADLQACYATALATSPSLSGTGVVMLDIADTGAVTLKHMYPDDLKDCFKPILERMTFPAGKTAQAHIGVTLAPDGVAMVSAPPGYYARARYRRHF
jgi:hypothetical protein